MASPTTIDAGSTPAPPPCVSATPVLRDYQHALAASLIHRLSTRRDDLALDPEPPHNVCVYLPTGGGKTRIAAHVCKHVIDRGGYALFIVNRNKLVQQAAATFTSFNVNFGYIKSGHTPDADAPLQIASIQTLIARYKHDPGESEAAGPERAPLPRADIVFIDEAHGACSPSFRWLVRHYRRSRALVVGLTATPVRMRPSESLARVFPTLLRGPSVPDLIRRGVLVAAVTFAVPVPPPPRPSSARVPATKPESLDAVTLVPPPVGSPAAATSGPASSSAADIVAWWQRKCAGRPTLAFAADVAHAQLLVRAFASVGVAGACISGETPEPERDDACAALAAGELKVIASVNVISEGFDVPAVSAIILARPTHSRGLYIQQVCVCFRARVPAVALHRLRQSHVLAQSRSCL
jgi:DNA repair protein RadD